MISRRTGGFTLVEVMVSLVIFAAAALALLSSVNDSTRLSGELGRRQWADIVAHNAMVDMTLSGDFSNQSGRATQGGIEYQWSSRLHSTVDSAIRRTEVEVRQIDQDAVLASLSAFVGGTGVAAKR